MGCGVQGTNHLKRDNHPCCGEDQLGYMWDRPTFDQMATEGRACLACVKTLEAEDLRRQLDETQAERDEWKESAKASDKIAADNFQRWLLSQKQLADCQAALAPIDLNPGEHYAGAIGDTDGNVHHVILLPGDNDDATWQHQKEWAASIGGDLPTRLEQSLLWQNCREHFKKDWYWSSEAHVSEAGWAWCQRFNDGGQGDDRHGSQIRARAVRRLILSDLPLGSMTQLRKVLNDGF